MKKIILFLLLFLSSLPLFADGRESVRPTFDVYLERKVDIAYIEEDGFYENVIVEINAARQDAVFGTGVKITVKDPKQPKKKKIYQTRFYNSFLYGFSDGSLQIGKGNVLTQVVISKNFEGLWIMRLKWGGIY